MCVFVGLAFEQCEAFWKSKSKELSSNFDASNDWI